MSIFRVEGSPDKIFCPNCKIVFAVSQDSAHIQLSHVPTLLSTQKSSLAGKWMTVAELKTLVEQAQETSTPVQVQEPAATLPPETPEPTQPLHVQPAEVTQPAPIETPATNPAPFLIDEFKPGEFQPEEIMPGAPETAPFIDETQKSAADTEGPMPQPVLPGLNEEEPALLVETPPAVTAPVKAVERTRAPVRPASAPIATVPARIAASPSSGSSSRGCLTVAIWVLIILLFVGILAVIVWVFAFSGNAPLQPGLPGFHLPQIDWPRLFFAPYGPASTPTPKSDILTMFFV